MRAISLGVLVIVWITMPVILQSCCNGMSGDNAYYNIDDMSLSVVRPGTMVPPSKLSYLDFAVSFKVTRAALETIHGASLYACGGMPEISNQQISAILVTSSHDLVTTSGTTDAGENLNFLFIVDAIGHLRAPLSDLINNPLLGDFLTFSSDVVLSASQLHKFTFRISLDDGRVFTMETEELELLEG